MKITWRDPSVQLLIEEYQFDYGSDPIEIVRGLARDLVLENFSKGWIKPPFDMIKLAQLMKINVMPNAGVLDGRIIPLKDKKFSIEYNPDQRSSRINFSIAHEIGHTFFPDCAEKVRNRYTKEEIQAEDNWELEFLCNVAASELVLPYAHFSREVNNSPINFATVKGLAERYNASLEAVLLRYVEVVNVPCSFVIASYGADGKLRVDYSKSSRDAKLGLRKGSIIPEGSVAYTSIRPGSEAYTDKNRSEVFGKTEFSIFSIGLGSLKHSRGLRVGMLLIPKEDADLPDNILNTVTGDALEPRVGGNKIIVQVVNTSAGVGSGFGRAVSNKWKETKSELYRWKQNKDEFRLGETHLIKVSGDIWVFQILAQKGLRPTKTEIPLKYWALRDGLTRLQDHADELNASIHMPAIGAGQAGGDWKVIEGMIHSELVSKGIPVTVYLLNGRIEKPKTEPTPTLFDQFT